MDDCFSEIMQKLTAAGIESPRLETRLLIAFAADIAPSTVLPDIVLNEAQKEKLQQAVYQRTAHKPLDKILGHREFYKADFIVSEDVLSPRPDTEILVETALRYISAETRHILDLGTGSGCIIESILSEKPQLSAVAVDISAKSLLTAQKNAQKLGLTSRIKFLCADWFESAFIHQIGQKFDIIVSNPPYIPTDDIKTLSTEVQKYDPLAALDGGIDGYDSYRRIAELAPSLLNNDGFILLEAGIGQARDIAEIFKNKGLKLLEIVKDLGGVERCVVLQK